MCETIEEISIAQIDAYKIFAWKDHELVSAFKESYRNARGLSYPRNQQKITCNSNTGFFAFRNFEEACSIAVDFKNWNFLNHDLVVLPVTLYDVFGTSSMRLFCTHSIRHCPCLKAREIVVRYSLDAVNKFNSQLERMRTIYSSYYRNFTHTF